MKDGSLWGMGYNESNLISGSKKKYYNKFVKVISGGVKKVSAGYENVVIIKKNNTMYAWGKTWKSKKEHYSFNSQKIDSGVREISLTDTLGKGPILVYLKRSGTAYGMGVNEGYAFTDKYKKGWHSKPVKLMENIKHVYSASSLTLLLSKKGDLYWTGTQDAYPEFDWVEKMK